MSNEYKFIDKPRTTCALGGALAAISAMPEVIPIIHTSTGCGGNLMNSLNLGSGYWGSGYCSGQTAPSSAINETHIVFGGNERLREQIQSTLKLIDGKLYVVATGCMTEMIGDDAQGTVSEFSDENPIIAISTPSFKGDCYSGYEILLEGIFNRYLQKTDEKDEKTVNIFGLIPGYDPFFRGDLEEIERLGSLLGLKVNTFFTPTQTFENILSANKASLNIIFSRNYCGEFGSHFEEKHGTPYWVTDLPIGPLATDEFLRELSEKLNLDKQHTEDIIAKENHRYYRYFERTVDSYMDGEFRHYSATVTNSNYAIPLNKFLNNELGWVNLDVFVTDTVRNEDDFRNVFNSQELGARLTFEGSSIKISRAITQNNPENQGQRYPDIKTPLYIIGSGYDKQVALKRGAKFLGVSYPAYDRQIVTKGYAGYNGSLRLYEDLIGQIMGGKG
jgi:nitrogenase molybdenum-iron protein beta chain